MSGPLVTILIPSYNYGSFVVGAIESALAQTHEPCEVIVVDDGSTDDTSVVASRFVPAIRLITQENAGLVAVINRGLEEAAGEYFTVLSADDTFRPTYVERLLEAITSTPGADYAYSAMEYVGAQTGVFRARAFSPALLLAGNYVNGSALVRTADAVEAGGYNPSLEQVTWEDWDFFLRLLAIGKRGVGVDEPLLLYRRHEQPSRNPASRVAALRAIGMFRGLHPGLYRRRPRPLSDALLLAALVADKLRCAPCLRRLDRIWGL